MKIAVIGTDTQINELQNRIGAKNQLIHFKSNESSEFDVLFDLDFDSNPDQFQFYADMEGKTIILGTAKVQLEAVIAHFGVEVKSHILGINNIPTFIDRDLAEVTLGTQESNKVLFENMGWECRTVESRVGMVTPRIICMIINEAYYTLQEGTATKKDIDLGMKLGTAYPKGPFEWSEQIGIANVYELLYAMYQDTGEERYKICPLLKTEYLKSLV